jgi:Na+:H+ antiporter, NhaA family
MLDRQPLRLPAALREYLREEAAGGIVLMATAAVALAWASSPWRAAYDALWATPLGFQLGRYALHTDLRGWVNEGLMALFFLVVGLEIKRELVAGELASWRGAALPVVAAAGGMAVPAVLYAAVNAGGPGAAGWGVPMATDIAFALGVLALLGSRVPPALKVFLLTLAVVDDLGSILVVAVFYSQAVDLAALAAAAGLLLLVAGLVRVRVWWLPVHLALGLALWLALWRSGVSPALAGVAMGLLAPARGTVSLAERLAHDLHPLSAFVVVPLFALANAGVTVDRDALAGAGGGAVLAGILLGRVVGKPAGIAAAVWLAVRFRLAAMPGGASWRQLVGVATVAGIGFTVPLFVAGLAFPPGRFDAAVRLGLLLASVLAGAGGALVLLAGGSERRARRP